MQHYFLPWRRATSLVTAAAVLASQFAGVPPAAASPLGSSTASAGSVPPPSVSAIQSFQPDLFTGRATTSVPLAVAPGRKGMQPALALTYSSSARNGWVGVGWSLDLGYIERSTKNGTPKYDSSDTFTFLMQGVASELVRIPDGTYRAKDEGLFLRVEQLGVSGWEIRDKSGTRYVFGGVPGTEQSTSSGTFRWCLRKIVDSNGNFLTVAYAEDQGQLYPRRIEYTGHETNGLKDADPANYVDFITDVRPDTDLSLRSGAEVRTALRLKEVTAYAQGLLAWKYVLTYRQSAQTQRSLLERITQFGTDGVTSLPATVFSYQDTAAPAYTLTANNPTVSRVAWNVRQAGFDRGHENFGCVPPNIAEAWSDPTVVDGSANLGSVNASVSGDGNIAISFSQDVLIHAWTWVYAATPRTLSLSYTGAEACLYWEEAGSLQNFVNGGSIPVQAGWSVLHLTGYHQHSGWTNTLTGSVKTQVSLMSPSQFIKPQLAGDADGNGITDLITFDAATGTWSVSQAMSADFHAPTTWRTGFGSTSTAPLLGDWNGDGRTDIGTFNSGAWQFAASTGTAFQTGTISSYSGAAGTPITGDFNGDGVMDIGTFSSGTWTVALGNGSGFTAAASFTRNLGGADHDPLTGDFNGDGLTDIGVVSKTGGIATIALSHGSAFAPSAMQWISGFGSGQSYTSADFNGDGLTDVAYYDKSLGQVRYAPSTGTRFDPAQTLPMTFNLRSTDDNLQMGDFNGDGLADPAVFNTITGAAEIARSSGEFVDLLQTTRNGLGGSTSLTYTASTQCENLCPMQGTPKLPFVLPVVTATAVNDGMGHSVETHVHYRQGSYDAPTREFRGFGRVEVRDAAATVTITEFHQDDLKKGRPFRTQVQDADGTLWSKQEQAWVSEEPYPGVHFVKLDRTDSYSYDSSGAARHTGARLTYDAYGNVTRADSEGEIAVIGDERAAVTQFSNNAAAWLLGKPTLVQTLDASGAVVAQRRFQYDEAGRLAVEEEWLNLPAEQWLATQLAYDDFGNVTTVTDALGRTTTNTYDPTGTFLTVIRNTLGHQRTLTYDPRFGHVLTSRDANDKTTTTDYDKFGRVTTVVGPNDTLSQPSMLYEYDLTTLPSKTTVHSRIQSGQDAVLTVYAFADGLGGTIQTRAPAEQAGKQVVSGASELNNRGQVIRQWAPYSEDASSQYVPPFTLSLAPPVTYEYDTLGRLVRTLDPDGASSTTAYGNWSVTGTDANGHQARRTNDAYGRLAQVEEFEDGQTHTTTYAYDTLDNLLRVTDSSGNITSISYDSLGRKLGMDDPDMGHWTYAYDVVDNLTQQTDARGVTVAFAYDALNRLTSKSYTVPPSSGIQATAPVTYEYELAGQANAIGKLCRITDGSGTSRFEYDALGRLIRESKTIDATTYTIDRQYDLLGRLTELTYPDNEVVAYTYNAQGGIETIVGGGLGPEGGLSPTVTYVSNIDYNEAGQLTKIAYGNGVITDYTYNPQTLRLDRLVTDGPGGRLQDFSYAFDPVGNVSQITDAVHTGSQIFEYDALNRLTRATGAYGDFRYAYNPIGNMLEKEGMQMAYGAGTAGPHAVTSTSAGWAMRYDLNGNMVEKSMEPTPERSALLTQHLNYDAENRLVKVETAQEETVEVELQPGWNFFSLPVLPENGAVAVLLPNFAQDFEQIAKFDAATGSFSYYVGNPAFDDFSELEYGVGYQVYAKQAVKVSIRGKLPTRGLQQPVQAGWHLLPAITHSSAPASDVFAGISRSQTLGLVNGSLAAASTAEKGQAYFVQATAASTWTAPLPESVTTQFSYDGDGGRVKQITPEGTTTFLGESFEKAPDGKTTKYIFAGSQRLAAHASTGDLSFYHGDHLGSSNIVTNGAGQLVELAEHAPYGSLARREGSVEVAHKFTGHRQDSVSGLVFAQARYYDPSLGRFISADPTVQSPDDPQDLNRYSYARNNPINLVDPSGYGWLRQLISVVVAIVLMVLVPYLELPWLMATAFSAGVSAAADQQGKAIERSISSNSQQASAPTLQQNAGRMWTSFATNPAVANTASVVAGFTPGAGEVQDFAAAFYGVDAFTGEQLSWGWRLTSGAALFVPFVGGVQLRHGARALNRVVSSAEDTIPAGRRLSTMRIAQPDENFVRFETRGKPFSKVTELHGLKPGTFAAPTSELPLGQRDLASRFNLPNPEIPRPRMYGIQAPGDVVIGPRAVAGAPGKEVLFPFGTRPGTVSNPLDVSP